MLCCSVPARTGNIKKADRPHQGHLSAGNERWAEDIGVMTRGREAVWEVVQEMVWGVGGGATG